MRSVAWTPQHGDPDNGHEGELRQDDGDLSEVVQLIEEPLHRAHPFL